MVIADVNCSCQNTKFQLRRTIEEIGASIPAIEKCAEEFLGDIIGVANQ